MAGQLAVELVDRTMIELSRANPAFRPVIERALIGAGTVLTTDGFDEAGDHYEALLSKVMGEAAGEAEVRELLHEVKEYAAELPDEPDDLRESRFGAHGGGLDLDQAGGRQHGAHLFRGVWEAG